MLMSEQNNLFQIYKIKCQTKTNTNVCVWECECVKVEAIIGNIRARYLNQLI